MTSCRLQSNNRSTAARRASSVTSRQGDTLLKVQRHVDVHVSLLCAWFVTRPISSLATAAAAAARLELVDDERVSELDWWSTSGHQSLQEYWEVWWWWWWCYDVTAGERWTWVPAQKTSRGENRKMTSYRLASDGLLMLKRWVGGYWCRHLANRMKLASCFILAHLLHVVVIWRHPQHQKHIKHTVLPLKDEATATCNI